MRRLTLLSFGVGAAILHWWSFFDPAYLQPEKIGMLPRFTRIISSWDTAFEDKTTSDYVVGQVWGISGSCRYLLYSYRRHANLRATKQAMSEARAWAEERWPKAAHTILIEKSANGAEIIADLKRELTGVMPVIVSNDKTTRAVAASAPLESGNIYVPGHTAGPPTGYQAPDWVADLIEEAALFPNGKHDDQVTIIESDRLPRRAEPLCDVMRASPFSLLSGGSPAAG